MGKRTDFLYMSEQDMIDAGVNDAARCVDVCEEVFKLLATGDYLMGGSNHNSHGLALVFPETTPFPNMPVAGPDRRFVAMPAYLGGRFDICGNKWYGSNAANREHGLPRSVLTLVLNDKETGEPLAFQSANLLSSARTGCIPGVACRYLARKNSKVLAVVGCGAVNHACVAGIMSQVPTIEKIVCYNLTFAHGQQFADWAAETFGVEAVCKETCEEALAEADLVSVAASRKAPLVIEDEWVKPGTLMMLSGPMTAPDSLWENTTMVWDNTKLHEAYVADARASEDYHKGYAAQIGGPVYELIDQGKKEPLSEATDLGHIILGEKQGRTSDGERIIFIASGMAVFDLGWGYTLYQNALEKGIGQKLTLWDSPAQAE